MRALLMALMTIGLLAPVAAQSKEIEGVEFPESSSAAGSPVSLIGVGVRTKWMMNV